MVTHTNILFSVSAVRRMLGLDSKAAIQIREFFRVIWVWVKGKRPTFISKTAFKQHFVDRRKVDSKDVRVRVTEDGSYTAFSLISGRQYSLEINEKAIACTCEDYHNQIQYFGRGVCKHGYAVLNFLGFNSLKDYVNAWHFYCFLVILNQFRNEQNKAPQISVKDWGASKAIQHYYFN